MKVAIVHDWLYGGGAEKVVLELNNMFPEAPIYTSYCTKEWRERLDNKVVTGYLQHLGKIRKFVPFLRARWFSHLNLSGYDFVISSSGAEAKGIRVKKPTVHINYCHAPTHYYWSRYEEYMKHPGFGFFDPLARLGLKLLIGPMRKWDYKAAQRPDVIIANSTFTKNKIKEYYKRDAVVVFPPVDIERFSNTSATERKGFVITGRQTPYKRFDLAVEACSKLNLPLTVIGNGPDNARLRKLAGPSITFLGYLDEAELAKHIANAEAFLFPGIDDFGIAPVEAMAAGTPVIAYKEGGALDYVVPGKTGEFFEEQTVDSLCTTLQSFDATKYNPSDIKTAVQKFSKENFRENLQHAIKAALQ